MISLPSYLYKGHLHILHMSWVQGCSAWPQQDPAMDFRCLGLSTGPWWALCSFKGLTFLAESYWGNCKIWGDTWLLSSWSHLTQAFSLVGPTSKDTSEWRMLWLEPLKVPSGILKGIYWTQISWEWVGVWWLSNSSPHHRRPSAGSSTSLSRLLVSICSQGPQEFYYWICKYIQVIAG